MNRAPQPSPSSEVYRERAIIAFAAESLLQRFGEIAKEALDRLHEVECRHS